MKTTIKDVAKQAGVSTATVSLVLSNNARISSETKRKVQKAVKALNYYPSRSARGLVSKKTGNLGFILTDDHFLRNEPFYTKIFLGTEFAAHKHDFYILLTTVPKKFSAEDPLPRFVLENNVDGIIIGGKVPSEFIEKLNEYDIPLIFVDYIPPKGEFPLVLIDNIQGGIIATEHLIELGHKNIGFIGGDIMHPSIADRFVGYKRALEKANIEFNQSIVNINSPEPVHNLGYSAAKSLYESGNKFTALFACNDAMAIGAMQYFSENNIKISEDVSIIGFDDVESNMLLESPLTTVKVPKIEMGSEAVRLIVDAINQGQNQIKKILIPVELIIRSSTARLK